MININRYTLFLFLFSFSLLSPAWLDMQVSKIEESLKKIFNNASDKASGDINKIFDKATEDSEKLLNNVTQVSHEIINKDVINLVDHVYYRFLLSTAKATSSSLAAWITYKYLNRMMSAPAAIDSKNIVGVFLLGVAGITGCIAFPFEKLLESK